MSDEMKTSEALKEVEKLKNLFRATEHIEQVLQTVGQAQSKLSGIRQQTEQLTQENERLRKVQEGHREQIEKLKAKWKEEEEKLQANYRKRKDEAQKDFDEFVDTLTKSREEIQADYNRTKARYESEKGEMEKELRELEGSLTSVREARDKLRNQLRQV